MWVKDIQKLANLTNRSFPDSAAEEIHFWSSIGEALEVTNTELRYMPPGRVRGRFFVWVHASSNIVGYTVDLARRRCKRLIVKIQTPQLFSFALFTLVTL